MERQDKPTATAAATETATLGGGCFWCLEAVFDDLAGVRQVESGYAGGALPNPDYDAICSGTTGHAEVVRIVFEPSRISYRELLEIFFVIHDPTTLNRQGNDRGSQYRSVIFYHSPQQRASAERVIAELDAALVWNAPIVTELSPAPPFYRAEKDHQGYYRNNPDQPYCRLVVAPKMEKLRRRFAAKRK
jgi:peptide-methionine (S)-S-oxide reductase